MLSHEDIFIESRVFSYYTINNFTFLVRKTVKQHLAEPYGQCNRYESRKQSSRTQCYRQCVQNQYNNRYNCVPIFIDNYNHDLDLKHIRNQFCEQLFNSTELPSMASITYKCNTLCHKECHRIRYTTSVKRTKSLVENKEWFNHFDTEIAINLVLDSGQPMFQYIEEPVLTFTDYLVYCGGLVGLWFGTSAHDVIVRLMQFNYRNIIHKIKMFLRMSIH